MWANAQRDGRPGARAPENVYMMCHRRRRPNIVQTWLASADRRRCSKSQIPLRYLLADRSEAGRRPAASWNLAYHLARY